jgi:HEAT repeat protein
VGNTTRDRSGFIIRGGVPRDVTDWADRLGRATALRNEMTNDPGAVASSLGELLELARDGEWIVARTAVEALGIGLGERPEAGVSALEDVVWAALDASVPSSSRWREAVVAVFDAAPEAGCEAALSGFEAVSPDRRGDAGTVCVTRALERVAVDSPSLFLDGDSFSGFRAVYPTLPPDARTHLLGAHLALVRDHREAVRPVLSDLLSAFETDNGETRRVAADLLCALARHPDDGPTVVEATVRFLAAHPRAPREEGSWLGPRTSVVCPSLTATPPTGTVGLAGILARVAEESPDAVTPHYQEIATALAARESTFDDRRVRGHLTRALAAVTRQRPRAVAPAAETVLTLLDDDAPVVRYWAAQAVLAVLPVRPDTVSLDVLDLLTDPDAAVRGVSEDLAVGCVTEGVVDGETVVGRLQGALLSDSNLEDRRAFSVLRSLARHDPTSVRPVVSTAADALCETVTATDAGAVVEAVAEVNPEAVADIVPTLVDHLFVDSLTVQIAAAEALETVGTLAPSLLDDQLPVLSTVVDRGGVRADVVDDVLLVLRDRRFDDGHSVFEFVRGRSTVESTAVRRRATSLLGAFVEADTGDRAAMTTLTDRLNDPDPQVREAALDGLAGYVADVSAESLVRSVYRPDTADWRATAADLLSRATLFDGTWLSASFRGWLAGRLHEGAPETRRSFVEAAGYVCGQTEADELLWALLGCLDDGDIAEAAFDAVRAVVTDGVTTVPTTDLATAVERTVLDPDRSVPSACLDLLPFVAADLDAPERVADRLRRRLVANESDTGRTAAALAALVSEDDEVALPATTVVSAIERYALDEPVSDRDQTCRDLGRVLRAGNRDGTGVDALCDTFVPMASEGPAERRATAYNVLASAANGWPAGVRPAVETLQAGVRDDDDRVSASALSALVAVARAFPAVLRPVAGWVVGHRSRSENVVRMRRRYEALSLLAETGVGADPGVTVARTLRAGLLDGDGTVREHALEAAAELEDPRLIPVLERLAKGVPDWGSTPEHRLLPSDEGANAAFGDLFVSDDPHLTAADVLRRIGR